MGENHQFYGVKVLTQRLPGLILLMKQKLPEGQWVGGWVGRSYKDGDKFY